MMGSIDGLHDDATQRLRAAQASRSPAQLIASLDDPSPEVVRAAIARLVDLEGPRAADALRARVLDVDLSLVTDIAGALRRIRDSEVVEVAIEALGDERYSRRFAATRALGALGDARAADPLRAMLGDDVAGVRAAALEALARLGESAGPKPGADCAGLLSDPVPHVRIAAIRAVARLVNHPGEFLAAVAEDPDGLVRLEVARHVAGLPERAATSLLADPDLRVREAAARAAGAREVGALAVLLTDDPARDVRRASAHALGAMRNARVADVLIPGLEDPDALVRAAVLRALEELLTRERAVTRLRHELANDRPERRRASVYALAHLKVSDAAPEVSRLADDPDPDVRLALIHGAHALFEEPEALMRYLAADSDRASVSRPRCGCCAPGAADRLRRVNGVRDHHDHEHVEQVKVHVTALNRPRQVRQP
jgi:HEAT repeat protein